MRGFRVWSAVVTLLVGASTFAAAAPAGAEPNVVPRPLCCAPTGFVNAVAVSGNTAYVGGKFHHLGLPAHHLAVLGASDGQLQQGWPGVDGSNFFVHVAIGDGNGGWFIGGFFTSIGGVPRQNIAHLLPDKTVDPNWVGAVNGQVDALVRDGNVLYVGGGFSQVNGGTARQNVAAFDTASGAVTGFQADTDGPVRALAISSRIGNIFDESVPPVRRLYIGGDFGHVNSVLRGHLAAIDLANGSLVGPDPRLNGSVTALAVGYRNASQFNPQPIGHVWVGGSFTVADLTSSNLPRNNGARYTDGLVLENWNPAVSTNGSIALSGTTLYTALESPRAVDADTGAAKAWAPVVTSSSFGGIFIHSVLVLGDTVYIGGRFDHAAGVERKNLAAFDASTGAVRAWDPDPPDAGAAVQSLSTDGTSLLASGDFAAIAGFERHNLAAVDLSTGQPTAFNPDMSDEVTALAVRGNTVYAGGKFLTVSGGSLPRHRAAAFDATTGQPTAFDPNVNDMVRVIAPAAGSVFLGGDFSTVNGGSLNQRGLVEVDPASGAATTFRQGVDGNVSALAVRDDTVFAGGDFNHMGGSTRESFGSARFSPGTAGSMTALDLGLDANNLGLPRVKAMLLRGPLLYVGGEFDEMLGTSRAAIGAFDFTTNVVAPLDPKPNLFVTSLADSEQSLFASGNFSQFGGVARPGIVSADPQTGTPNDWSPTLPADGSVAAIATSPDGGLVAGGSAIGPTRQAQGLLLAWALQPSMPAAPQATAGAGQATVDVAAPANGGSPITQYKVTVSPGGQTVTAGTSPITVTGLTPGTSYTFTARATNAAGDSLPSPPSNAVTPSAPSGGPGSGGGPGGGAFTASGFKVTNKRFKVGKKKTALVAKTPQGTTFVFNLSAAAVSRIVIERTATGRKKGTRCVAPRPGLKKRCTRYLKVKNGTLTRKRTKAGSNRVPFSGRLNKTALKPGTYRGTLTATDAGGHRTKPLRVTFVVVKR